MNQFYLVQTRSGQIISSHPTKDLANCALNVNPLPGREVMTSTRWENEFNWMRCN